MTVPAPESSAACSSSVQSPVAFAQVAVTVSLMVAAAAVQVAALAAAEHATTRSRRSENRLGIQQLLGVHMWGRPRLSGGHSVGPRL